MAIELEVFTEFDHPPTLSQLQAGVARLARTKVVFEKKKEETEAEWTWAHFFAAATPDVGGFSIDRAVVNRRMRETLEKLKAPLPFIRAINWCFTLSAPEGTDEKEIEMMYAAAGVLAKYSKGKVYDPQEDAILEADELAGSLPELSKQRDLLAGARPPAAAAAANHGGANWKSIAISAVVLIAAGYVVLKILENIVAILTLIGAVAVAVVGFNYWKKERQKK